jgi:hypothetical protein
MPNTWINTNDLALIPTVIPIMAHNKTANINE